MTNSLVLLQSNYTPLNHFSLVTELYNDISELISEQAINID